MKPTTIRGSHESRTIQQIERCVADERATRAALCADGHVGYNMPIGGVVAYREAISPAGVGFDIACGNKAVRLDTMYSDIKKDLSKLADEIWNHLEFGIGRRNQERFDHELFEDPTWNDVPMLRDETLREKARNQLGTIGSGNHYVDVFKDEKGRIWVGVHFGSRGLGHTIATEYIQRGGANPNGSMDLAPCVLGLETEDGQEYVRAMALAGRYAYAGRDWACAKVAEILKAEIVEEVHNHHNFAWQEAHDGETVWVVRKGATPAFPGQRGFVGGSMGDQSVILEGVESPAAAELMYSTVHGAGRVMSRTRAAGKAKHRNGRMIRVTRGEVNMKAVRQDLAERGIHLRGAGADEAPQVYKRLPQVLKHHEDTVRILHRLDPLIVCMAGENEFDPYKD